MTSVVCDIVKLMFAGDDFSPPSRAVADLSVLASADSSLVFVHAGRDMSPVLRVHPWPSWLTRGSPKVVDFFL